jgi:hypothetical protein
MSVAKHRARGGYLRAFLFHTAALSRSHALRHDHKNPVLPTPNNPPIFQHHAGTHKIRQDYSDRCLRLPF